MAVLSYCYPVHDVFDPDNDRRLKSLQYLMSLRQVIEEREMRRVIRDLDELSNKYFFLDEHDDCHKNVDSS